MANEIVTNVPGFGEKFLIKTGVKDGRLQLARRNGVALEYRTKEAAEKGLAAYEKQEKKK